MKSRKVVRMMSTLFLALTVICVPARGPGAERGYISAMLVLTMRAGPGEDFGIIRTLRSNMPVDILESRDGYTRVKTEQGDEGWIESQYLTRETPSTFVIERLEKTIADLEKNNRALLEKPVLVDSSMEAVKSEFEVTKAELQTSLKSLQQEKELLSKQIAISEKKYQDLVKQSETVVEIARENASLKEMNAALENALALARNERSVVFKTLFIKWFLAGAGTLILGWIVGRSMGGRKRSSGLLG
ncbi:MAG: TIGR04211 family SH3 domain-containing protein [Pseudomonadota bacterium]